MLSSSKYAFDEEEIDIIKSALIDAMELRYMRGDNYECEEYNDLLNAINDAQNETAPTSSCE